MLAGAASFAIGFSMSGFAAQASSGYYYDGANKRTITLEPALVAEFSIAAQRSINGSRVSGLASADKKFITLHPVSTNAPPSSKSKAFSTGTPASLVFHEGSSTAGRLMALPGGVIVHFKPEWSNDQISNWLSSKSYIVRQKLAIKGNWYVIQSPSGQASLDLANQIHESGEVLSASPDWWKETIAK
jgi:hypothetical protein